MTCIAWSLVSFATLAMSQFLGKKMKNSPGGCRRNEPSGGRSRSGLRRGDM